MSKRPKIAFYGGTFDPVHCGHVAVAKALVEIFSFDEFSFLPAYHAPHKPGTPPTSAYHRFAMLTLATQNEPGMSVSTLELDHATKRYSFDTMTEINSMRPDASNFFIMGADSWKDIRTWYRWDELLLMTNHVVVTRPGYDITFEHVTDPVRRRIVDLRNTSANPEIRVDEPRIYVTDAVRLDISATEIREDVRQDDRLDNADDVPEEVAKYIEKYELYK
ncbi:MAG TPA: nicotinate (nicotinamide) nucleotide adenylyltransferase [Pyrinomonadaceae bacterium]|nr:nicotinate (nicotinamide) nucleotide adenylyltransferase [Pyrinomonadaceae bacterium]